MLLKLNTWLDFFIIFILLVKIVFIISAIGHFIFSHSTSDRAKNLDPKFLYWKERTEFIFIVSISILLIYYFHPRLSKKPIDKETAILFFAFGWVLLFTAKWSLFFTQARWYDSVMIQVDKFFNI